jgi:hypothetical protein
MSCLLAECIDMQKEENNKKKKKNDGSMLP